MYFVSTISFAIHWLRLSNTKRESTGEKRRQILDNDDE